MKKIERLEGKIDKVLEHIGSLDSTAAAQAIQLKEHIRRTALLEEELKPIKKHVNMVDGVVRFLLYLFTAGAGLEGLHLILKHL